MQFGIMGQSYDLADGSRSKPFKFLILIISFLLCIVVSTYLRRFVFLFPLLLSTCWLIYQNHNSGACGRWCDLLPKRLKLALSCLVLSYLASNLFSSHSAYSLQELLVALVGPIIIATFAGQIVNRSMPVPPIKKFMVIGLALLVTVDITQYFREFLATGQLAAGFTHRWCATAYILYMPFLFIIRDSLIRRDKLICYICIFICLLIAVFTGSRTAWGTILLEIVILGLLKREPQYILDMLILLFTIFIAVYVLPYNTGMASLKLGFSDNNRINGHWKPAINMISSSTKNFLVGDGYGSEVVVPQQYSGQSTPLKAGPHNIFLQSLLAGGVLAFISTAWLFAELGHFYWRNRNNRHQELNKIAIGGGVAFISYFLIAGQVGDPRPEPLATFLLIAIITHRYSLFEVKPLANSVGDDLFEKLEC